MYQRPKKVILNQRPLVPREPWWWEVKYLQTKRFFIQLYELFIAFLVFVHVQFWVEEQYPGEYANRNSFGTNELRAFCLMRESAKLLAVMSKPKAVQNREQTILMYQQNIESIEKKLGHWSFSLLARWFPKSLHAHECKQAKKTIALYQEFIRELQNTPKNRALKQIERIQQDIKDLSSRLSQLSINVNEIANPYHDKQREVALREKERLEKQLKQLEEELATDDDCTLDETQRFSYKKEREFSSNIDPWYYEEKERWNHLSEMNFMWMDRRDLQAHDGKTWKELAKSLVHPDLNKWLTRKMSFCYHGTEVEGNIHLIMWFNPLKFCFLYTTNLERMIDSRILQAAAIKYVLTYRCVDFMVDDDYFTFMRETTHPEIRKYFLQEERQFQRKKKVRQPDGEFVWMLEDEWMDGLLQRAGFDNYKKYKLIENGERSEIKDAGTMVEYTADGAMIPLSAPPCTQEEIDDEYLSKYRIVERAPNNPNAVTKIGKRVKELEKQDADYKKKVRVRFERAVQSEDIPEELTLQRDLSHIPYFTNKEFEIHTIMYHGPGSEFPINRTGKMMMDTDPMLNGLHNSQKMIEFAYENATPSTILDIGMKRLEDAKEEAKRLCITTGRDEDDYGVYVRQMRIDENAKVNSEAVEKFRITYDVNQLLMNGMDSTELLLQLEALPASSSMKTLLDAQRDEKKEDTTKLLTNLDPSVKFLLENGNNNSNYLQVHGYYSMHSEEKKQELEDKLIEMRRECVTKRLNEVANTMYFSSQVQQNVRMMQNGRYIDKKKESLRFRRFKHSDTFKAEPKALLTYQEYIENARQVDNGRRAFFLELAKQQEEQQRFLENQKYETTDSSEEEEDEEEDEEETSEFEEEEEEEDDETVSENL